MSARPAALPAPAIAPQKKKQKTVSSLKSEKAKVKKDIAQQQKKLSANEQDVSKRLKTLMALDAQIISRKRDIDSIQANIRRLDQRINTLEREIETLKQQLEENKDRYVKSVRYMRRNRSIQSQILFIFSADNFSQMYRRMRFMKEYAAWQRAQGEAIKAKQEALETSKKQLADSRWKQKTLLKKGEEEQKKLEKSQADQKKMVASLKKQQKTIQAVIEKQKKRDAEIDAEIDRLIALEIEKSQKAISKGNSEAPARDVKLSGSFESNKGRLPMPMTGSIVSHFGQYNVEGLKGVKLDNKGINIQGNQGARVRAIYDGEVSAVFSMGGVTGVMVRHGSYISVYCNLGSVSVKKGQKVATNQMIGTVGPDRILQFQLRKEKAKLNPEAWLAH